MTVDTAYPPRLAYGVELLGDLKDSGFAEPRSLVRRPDGQVIQLSRLLYLVTRLMDGARGAADIAAAASAELGRTLTAEQVRFIITAKLAPLGIVSGHGAPPPTASPLLALRARVTLLPAAASCAVGTFLRPLFRWPVIVAVIVSVVAVDYWILTADGLGRAFAQVLNNPVDMLLVGALSLASALFHECGHAAGCRYGGGRPGRIGAGLYLVWPAFFTNVTDSYRLSRAGRLRTDLGGLYFNMIFMLVLAAGYAATSAPILLLVIAITHLEMLEQLMPFVRFDGYFILSDLLGVPDLFHHVVPVLRDCLTVWRRDSRAGGLRRGTQIVITVWVLCVVPLLTLLFGYFAFDLPAVNRALWQSAARAAAQTAGAFAAHHYAEGAAEAVGTLLAFAAMAAMLYITVRMVHRAVGFGLRWSAGSPHRRLIAVLIAVCCAVPVSVVWLVQGEFSDW